MNTHENSRPFVIERWFAASPLQVWRAWTEADQLQLWFGPKGSSVVHWQLNLRPGGHFHYALRMPDGQEMWGLWTFRVIVPLQTLVLVNSFSDAQRGITRHPMSATWPLQTLSTTQFSADGDGCRLALQWEPLDASAEERATFDAAHAGMSQGWGGTMDQLDAYLAGLT